MFYLTGIEQLNQAIARAKAYKPTVKVVEFGRYTVTGEHGTAYTVECRKDSQGRKAVACECKGAQRGYVCKHAAAALQVHVYRAAQRQGKVAYA